MCFWFERTFWMYLGFEFCEGAFESLFSARGYRPNDIIFCILFIIVYFIFYFYFAQTFSTVLCVETFYSLARRNVELIWLKGSKRVYTWITWPKTRQSANQPLYSPQLILDTWQDQPQKNLSITTDNRVIYHPKELQIKWTILRGRKKKQLINRSKWP